MHKGSETAGPLIKVCCWHKGIGCEVDAEPNPVRILAQLLAGPEDGGNLGNHEKAARLEGKLVPGRIFRSEIVPVCEIYRNRKVIR